MSCDLAVSGLLHPSFVSVCNLIGAGRVSTTCRFKIWTIRLAREESKAWHPSSWFLLHVGQRASMFVVTGLQRPQIPQDSCGHTRSLRHAYLRRVCNRHLICRKHQKSGFLQVSDKLPHNVSFLSLFIMYFTAVVVFLSKHYTCKKDKILRTLRANTAV